MLIKSNPIRSRFEETEQGLPEGPKKHLLLLELHYEFEIQKKASEANLMSIDRVSNYFTLVKEYFKVQPNGPAKRAYKKLINAKKSATDEKFPRKAKDLLASIIRKIDNVSHPPSVTYFMDLNLGEHHALQNFGEHGSLRSLWMDAPGFQDTDEEISIMGRTARWSDNNRNNTMIRRQHILLPPDDDDFSMELVD